MTKIGIERYYGPGGEYTTGGGKMLPRIIMKEESLPPKSLKKIPIAFSPNKKRKSGAEGGMRKHHFAAIIPLVLMAMIFCLYFEVVTVWFVYNPSFLVPILNILFL